MKIEEQVLSIEQMKRLQELGVDTSDASMCWLDFEDNEPMEVAVFIPEVMLGYATCEIYPTYTIGDLIEKLPIRIGSVNRKIYFTGKYIIVSYSSPDGSLIEYRGTTLLCLLYSLLCWVAETHKELLEVKK